MNLYTTWALIVLEIILCYGEALMPHTTDPDQMSAVIKKLWSSSDRERSEGIEQIRRSGQRAIEPMVLLLSELVHNQEPRYAIGREEEGARALQEYVLAVGRYLRDDGITYADIKPFGDRLSALAINSRLMADVVHLLGELRAQPAVPILIEILNKRSGSGGLGAPENDALCRIGEAAVPALIKDLDESTIRAYGFGPVQYGYLVVAEAAHNAASETDGLDHQSEDDENLDREGEDRQIDLIRERVVWVLGEIGDPRSLPALQNLAKSTKNETLISRLNEAITKIKVPKPPADRDMRPTRLITWPHR